MQLEDAELRVCSSRISVCAMLDRWARRTARICASSASGSQRLAIGSSELGSGPWTAQQFGGEVAVDGKSGAESRDATQGAVIESLVPEIQALHDTPQRFGIRRQMMAEGR